MTDRAKIIERYGSSNMAEPIKKMLCAIHQRDADELRDAIEQGAPVSGFVFKRYGMGITPLMKAAISSNVEICQTLLSAGSDISEVDYLGQDAVFYAAGEGGAALMELLIAKSGAEPGGLLPVLMRACERGNERAAGFLIGLGASVVDKLDGRDALMISAEYGQRSCAIAALVAGADPTAVNEQGLTALEIAIFHGDDRLAYDARVFNREARSAERSQGF